MYITHNYSCKWSVCVQEVYVHILDLSETKKVWEFAEGFKKKYKTLNVLVNDSNPLTHSLYSLIKVLRPHCLTLSSTFCFVTLNLVSRYLNA